jgi:ditrans,polycis-polyprenyl diphosphate synthase
LGNLSLAPEKIQQVARQVMETTQHHKNAILNICFSYTARHEMLMASNHCLKAVQEGILSPRDISVHLLDSVMYTEDCPPMDLLIRTSGEVRLSDFMLWQVILPGCLLLVQ